MAIRTQIIRIGNSRGVRIPKPLLEQAALGDEVELEVQGQQIIVRGVRLRDVPARAGWEERFRQMAEQGDDRLLDAEPISTTTWDDEEWIWKSDASMSGA
jgi:antitoxin MazE